MKTFETNRKLEIFGKELEDNRRTNWTFLHVEKSNNKSKTNEFSLNGLGAKIGRWDQKVSEGVLAIKTHWGVVPFSSVV